MNLPLPFFLVLIAALAPVFALEGRYSILTSTSTGLAVGMNLYVPPGYDQPLNTNKRYPLMVFLGGAGERGDPTNADVVLQKSTVWGPAKEIRYSDLDFPFIVVTPISTEWYNSLADEYNAMIEYLKSSTRIDPDRIYFTGGSAGASGVIEFAQAHTQQLAAIVLAGMQDQPPWAPERLQEMPSWFFHAFADQAVSRERTIVWVDAIANSFGYSPVSCMDNYPYGTPVNGNPTYNPDNHTGSFRPGLGWIWTRYTVPSDDSSLLFTMMSTDLHNVWQYAVTKDTVLHWMTKQRRQSPYGGTAVTLPGRVQAEAFDYGGHLRAYRDTTIANTGGSPLRETVNPYDGTIDREQVDLATGGDGTVLTGTAAGEWIEYMVNATSGTYVVKLRLSAPFAGGSLRLLNAEEAVLAGPVTVPVTNGFETIEIANVPLTAGNQTLRLAIDQGGFDLDWLEVDFAPGTADIIVDNLQTDKVTTSGSWSSSTSTPGYYASDYLAAAPGAIATAVFRPTLPRTCAYQISIHYPSQTASGIARVVIDPGDGGLSSTVLVDQRSGGGSWQSLGNFSLPAGTLATVSIAADGSPGYIHADALRFWEIDPVNNPPIVSLTAPDDGATVVSGAALTISAAASDPDLHSATPGVEKVKFYANDVLIGIDPSDSEDPATYSISFTPTDPGVYILTAVAYDFVGGVADSPSRTLYVVNPAGGLLTFSSPSYAISEGNGLASVTIRVQRTGGSGAVSVEYAISDGTASSSDYNATNGAMTWPEGDASDKLFSVAIIGETSPEADETVLLTLSNPTGDAALGTPSSASLVILDDDTTGSGIGSPTRPRSGVGSGSNCGSGSGIALLLALLALIATPIAHPARSRS